VCVGTSLFCHQCGLVAGKNCWQYVLLVIQCSRERLSLTTCAECKIVNTAMADDKVGSDSAVQPDRQCTVVTPQAAMRANN